MSSVPTLLEWLGGPQKLRDLMAAFYDRVLADPLLSPVFAGMPREHFERVTDFIAEVFGGPTEYSAKHGGHAAMIRRHLGRKITEQQRQRWMQLLLDTADRVGAPTDPEFRSAFVGYLEWGTRLAVMNSQPGVPAPPEAPMPRWGWGETGGPFTSDS